MPGIGAAAAMSRHARNLGHAKQARIKKQDNIPKDWEGTLGDMILCKEKFYVKDDDKWIVFTGKPANDKKAATSKGGQASNGYKAFDDGIIIQWGEQSSSDADWANDSEHTVTFPKKFPNECFKVLAGFETTTNIDGAVGISAKSKTGCTFRFDEWATVTQAGKFVYIAIGN